MSARTSDPKLKQATSLWSDEKWIKRAVSRLLPGGLHMTPPAGWRCGNKPSSPLSIDENVTRLRKSEHKPKLRPDVQEIVLCPYWYARFMTALAAVLAAREASQSDELRLQNADRWRELANQSSRLNKKLAQVFDAIPPEGKIVFPEDRWTHHEAPVSITKAYRDVGRAISALSTIEEYARFRRKVLKNNQGDIWRITFVTQLGFTWRVLTGTEPTNSKEFLDFVTAAWSSLCEDVELSWDWSVRRALKLHQGDWACYEPQREDGAIRIRFESRSLPRKKNKTRKR